MTRSKKLTCLLALLLILSLATFVVMNIEKKQENIKNTDEIVLQIPYDDIKNVKWTTSLDKEGLSFTKNDSWVYDYDESFPVNEELMEKLLKPFEALGADFIIESPEDINDYGFNTPEAEIEISTENETYKIALGNFSTMDSQRYISTGDGNVYLVDDDPFPRFNKDFTDFIQNDKIPEIERVEKVTFSGKENYEVVRNEEEGRNTLRSDDVFFVDRDGTPEPLSPTAVKDYVNTMKYLSFDNFVNYKADAEALKEYGLDEPELGIKIDYIYLDDEGEEIPDSLTLHISRDPEELKEIEENPDREKDEDEKITAYMRLNDSPIVYRMIESDYTHFMHCGYDDLRHREIIPCDFKDVSQIDIELDGSSYTITSSLEDDIRKYYYNDEQIDITNIESSVNLLKADKFINTSPDDKKEIGLRFHLDFKDEPVTYVDIYRYDDKNCLITIDGNSFALVERHKAVDLIEDINSIVLKKAEEIK